MKTNKAFLKAAGQIITDGNSKDAPSFLRMAEKAAEEGMEHHVPEAVRDRGQSPSRLLSDGKALKYEATAALENGENGKAIREAQDLHRAHHKGDKGGLRVNLRSVMPFPVDNRSRHGLSF